MNMEPVSVTVATKSSTLKRKNLTTSQVIITGNHVGTHVPNRTQQIKHIQTHTQRGILKCHPEDMERAKACPEEGKHC